MARRSRRADEVTPKLHYRPGVDDPDLEATIVGFYGTRQEVPGPSPVPLQPIDNSLNCQTDNIAVELKETVSADSRDTVAAGTTETVSGSPQDTVVPRPTDTVAAYPEDTVAIDPRDTVAVYSRDSVTVGLPSAGDRTEERGRTYERIANKYPTDTVSVDTAATVAVGPETVAVERPPGPTKGLWYTEGKEGIFPASRIRRIVLAQDALTHAEESVYDVLWGPKNQNRDDQRLTSIGYDGIAKAARVTKMNAKWIVERLVHKGFVKVETLPDPLRRIPTSYRVFGYRAALEDMRRRNRFYIIRTGNGVLFAHPYNPADNTSPEPRATVPVGQPATVSLGQAETVPPGPQATVSVADTHLDNSSKTILIQVISTVTDQIIGNDAAVTIVSRCRAQAPDFTNQELADITKTEALKAIREKRSNLIGWLITVLPGRFAGESLRIYRETQQTLREQERQEREAQAQRWHRILDDPTEDEEFKKLAREALGIELGREETK
jgi:hypothetical protein